MMLRTTAIALCIGLGLTACEPTTPDASGGAGETPAAGTGDTSGQARAEAELAAVEAQVASDTETCTMPEGAERWSQAVDLGGGVGAVVMQCSAGMPDMWNQLFIIQEGGGHHMAVPLVQYGIQASGEWQYTSAQPNLEWDPAERVFVSTISGGDLCGSTSKWRWDEAEGRVAMVSVAVQDCEGVTDPDNLPEPRVIWPTDPATPEPSPA